MRRVRRRVRVVQIETYTINSGLMELVFVAFLFFVFGFGLLQTLQRELQFAQNVCKI